mgnify:CR=1 FL=1
MVPTKSVELETKNINSKQKVPNVKERSYHFSLDIIRFVSRLPNQRIFIIIGNQLLRSATSVGANIIEAQAASSRKDFIKFYQIVLKSANETVYWISLLKDSFPQKIWEIDYLITEASEIGKMLGRSLITLKAR